MNARKKRVKVGLLLVIALGPTALFAEEEGDSRGFLLSERIQGSGSSLGLITKFDTAVGYQFNRYLAIETGMPVYVVNPSSSAAQTTGTQGQSRIGNAHVDLRLSLANPAVNYTSMATVAAPTGDNYRFQHRTCDLRLE
jgi:hypothetical protein